MSTIELFGRVFRIFYIPASYNLNSFRNKGSLLPYENLTNEDQTLLIVFYNSCIYCKANITYYDKGIKTLLFKDSLEYFTESYYILPDSDGMPSGRVWMGPKAMNEFSILKNVIHQEIRNSQIKQIING